MPSKTINLKQLAELCNVSKTTVSMVLNGHAEKFKIKAETQHNILAMAKKYNYRANLHAKALQSKRSDTVGLVVPDFTNIGFSETSQILEKLCRENGLQLLIACSNEDATQEEEAIESLIARQVDILVLTPTNPDTLLNLPNKTSIPVIQLDRYIADSAYPYIVTDDTFAVKHLLKNLFQMRNNFTECYYLGGQPDLRPSRARKQGIIEGVAHLDHVISTHFIETYYSREAGYSMISNLYNKLERLPQLIFCGSYAILEGVLRFLNEKNLLNKLLSNECQLLSFDDYSLLNCLPFKITTIQQDHPQIAKNLFTMIQARLAGKEVENQILPAYIQWRN